MTYPACVPELTDGRVRLRAHRDADVPAVVEQSHDPESLRWTRVPRDNDEAGVRSWLAGVAADWEKPTAPRSWAIEWTDDAGTARFAGTIDLRPRGGGGAEIGYGLHPAARGRGVMAAALRLVCAWWFEHGGEGVTWFANAGNLASWRVAWACGFRRCGAIPAYLPHPDGLKDAWVATLAKGDPMRPAHRWSEPPVLEGGRVRLRPIRDDDTAVAEPHDHPAHHLPARAVPTLETFGHWLGRRREKMSTGESFNWCIADAATDEPLGEVLVFTHGGEVVEGGTAELGYFVRPSARGRRVAAEAARLATAYALAPVAEGGLGLRRLVAETASDNAGSNRVLELVGFTRWGHEAAADAPDGSVGPADRWERYAG